MEEEEKREKDKELTSKKEDEKITSDCKEKPATKKEIEVQNKMLRNFFIGIGAFILVIVLVVLFVNSIKHFEYKEVKFNIVKEGKIIFYNTAFPMYHSVTGQHVADYNFYIRNDPRKLEKIPFNGELVLLDNLVINMTGDFHCDGDGIIAIANLVKLYEVIGTQVMKDENATCDSLGRYMFIQIQPGDETSIEQFGPACYKINVNNCEILEATERFMAETFVKINN